MKRTVFVFAIATITGMLTSLPAHAVPMLPTAPPPCDTSFVYPTETFTLQQSNNIVVTLTLLEDGKFVGPARHTVAGKPDVTGGSVQGDVSSSGRIDFFVDWHNDVNNHYYGDIDADGIARGISLNSNVHKDGWFSLDKFTCAPFTVPGVQGPVDARAGFEPPPGVQGADNSDLAVGPPEAKSLQGPTVSFERVIGGLVAHVTDRSGVASQCVYESELVQRAFALPAKSTFDVRIVPALPQFRNWDVTVSCDNGTSTKTSTFF